MLVELHQYREADTTDSVRDDGDVSPDRDDEDYLGIDAPGEEWKRTQYGDRTIQYRAVTRDGVTDVSLPSLEDREPGDLPGLTIQLIVDGENEFIEAAEVIEVTDPDPE